MPEVAETHTEPVKESLGWRAGLPSDLQQNETFKSFKTVGELGKSYLETTAKYSELERKLGDYVPKLPDNPTDEDKNLYFNALGRPETATDYEFEGEDKNAPEWTNHWKQQFHSLGLTKAQAKTLSASWNKQMQAMVEAHNTAIKNEMAAAEGKLRSEMGDKYDTNVELAKRLWTKYGEGEFDKAFENGNSAYRATTIRMLLKFAALTGEDRSPQGGTTLPGGKKVTFIAYDKSPEPPKKG
jgi:hypothetical protein